MNIKRAKQEIMDTIDAYLMKDEYGEYVIPQIRQRPVLLIGAPGIGKTQIMEQAARESGIALVSYSITHHTRQSAIGLPFISRQEFDGKEYSVTEYTMSEIIASVYQKMRDTGLREGILFLDEINCVSETLAPAMLQFLQCKTFGTHKIPEGWIIAAAGNPPEYNKSVREFDVVTMDRVKKIEVEPDYSVWKEYAQREEVHPAVISYLDVRPGSFYKMETTADGHRFATPRGWEDLSTMLKVYERLGKKMDREVAVQYIQEETIAKDFANYLELYRKYQMDYQVDAVLSGQMNETLLKKAAHAPFDERFSLVGLLLSRCRKSFAGAVQQEDAISLLYDELTLLKKEMGLTVPSPGNTDSADPASPSADACRALSSRITACRQEYEHKKKASLLTREEDRQFRQVLKKLEGYLQNLRLQNLSDPKTSFSWIQDQFEQEQDSLDRLRDEAGALLEHAFDFMEAAFGNAQEMVLFITDLNTDYYSIRFLNQYECERYYRYNKELLFDERSRSIEERLKQLDL